VNYEPTMLREHLARFLMRWAFRLDRNMVVALSPYHPRALQSPCADDEEAEGA